MIAVASDVFAWQVENLTVGIRVPLNDGDHTFVKQQAAKPSILQ